MTSNGQGKTNCNDPISMKLSILIRCESEKDYQINVCKYADSYMH